MSRIGLKAIPLPSDVSVNVKGSVVHVKGKKGELSLGFPPSVSFDIGDGSITAKRIDDSKSSRAMHGLYRSLVNNMIVGVSSGFTRTLVINGVGYRAELQGKSIIFSLGYSNAIEYLVPEGIEVDIQGNNVVTLSGINKEKVGQTAAEIRSLRPPEPYKGKGIRYRDEVVRRKVGKTGVK